MRILGALVIAIVCAAALPTAVADGDLRPIVVGRSTIPARPIERSTLRGPSLIPRDPLPGVGYRPVCWGAECNEVYGPTYYYPSDKTYEGNHPQYYPFFHPRGWGNYKVPPPATADVCGSGQCGSSRSLFFWDSHDDWMRGGRYEERQ